ncbi:uncharacterized protein LOC135160080 [Diachasmimorpha longicaudata]|uniref:uncharacterized protein LOC135160080 n=1 Tax=Diachasmimorpha longicaudata TaxID=58733 RepID=UPI0030B915D8
MWSFVNRNKPDINRFLVPVVSVVLVLPLVSALSHQTSRISNTTDNFIITKSMKDGEINRIFHYQGICGRETILNWGETSVALRELVLENGKRLQLIYEGDNLTECVDVIDVRSINEDICGADDQDQRYKWIIRGSRVPSVLDWLGSTSDIVRRCHGVSSRARSHLFRQQFQRRRVERSLQQMVIAPGTKWCGPHHIAAAYKDLGGLDSLDRCCRRHDHCCRSIPPFSERYNFWNYMPFTLSHCGCDQRECKDPTTPRDGITPHGRRRKRDVFMIPGTKWCGRGNHATKYTNLGGFGKADACCRKHDTACRFWIPALGSRYGLANWRISTLMHCSCDERFRTCLKMAGTSSANFVGKIFFNMVQTKCFVFKPQKVCTRHSWWGKCEKYKYKKQAFLRNNVPY